MSEFWENFWGNFWAVLAVIIIAVGAIVGILLVVLLSILGFASCEIQKTTAPVAEITELSVGYWTESDYNGGSFSEGSVTRDAVFTRDTPFYMVIDFTIRTIAASEGGESVRIAANAADSTALTTAIQEAPTGKLEAVTGEDGSKSYDLFYAVPSQKDEEKTVRMILKQTPRVSGDVAFHILVSGGNGRNVNGQTSHSLTLHVGEAHP